jgi:hypothetical protein
MPAVTAATPIQVRMEIIRDSCMRRSRNRPPLKWHQRKPSSGPDSSIDLCVFTLQSVLSFVESAVFCIS